MTEAQDQAEITLLLNRWRNGDTQAMNELMPLIYPNLHSIAKKHMRRERANHTLSPSALLNEAYLRLIKETDRNLNNRLHFFAVASRTMSHILMSHATHRKAQKRGAGQNRRAYIEVEALGEAPAQALVNLSIILKDLEKKDPAAAHLVMMRYYGGLTIEEIARVLGVSVSTVKRDLQFPIAWIGKCLKQDITPLP